MKSLYKYEYLSRYLTKESRNQSLDSITAGQGPQQMSNALNMLEQARALVRPDDSELGRRNIGRAEFSDTVEELAQRPGESYNIKDIKADPKKRAIWAGLAGALGGGTLGLSGSSGKGLLETLVPALTSAAVGGGAGALGGYLTGTSRNRKLRGTLNVLKDSGLLKPDYLRRAKPLLVG
jgi:hypothetical protein